MMHRDRRFHEDFPVTSFLLLFNVSFFALEVIAHVKKTGDLPSMRSLGGISEIVTHHLGSLSLSGLRNGEYWRLISSTFIHANIIHLLCNMVVLFDIGRLTEPYLSSWKLITIYVSCALGAALASLGYGWYEEGAAGRLRSSVGASGAISGLIGLILVHAIRSGNTELRNEIFRWILIMVALSLAVSNLDHAGHIGGFLTGCIFGIGTRGYITSSQAKRWSYPGYAAGAAILVSLGISVARYFLGK